MPAVPASCSTAAEFTLTIRCPASRSRCERSRSSKRMKKDSSKPPTSMAAFLSTSRQSEIATSMSSTGGESRARTSAPKLWRLMSPA